VRLVLVSSTVCFGRTFMVFPRIFEARSTHVHRLLLDTHHPAVFPAVIRPWCWKLQSCRSPKLGAWSSRARAPLLSDCACRPRSAFSGWAWRRPGSTATDLLLVASGCGACSHSGEAASLFHCRQLFRVFCLCVVYSSCYYVQFAYV